MFREPSEVGVEDAIKILVPRPGSVEILVGRDLENTWNGQL